MEVEPTAAELETVAVGVDVDVVGESGSEPAVATAVVSETGMWIPAGPTRVVAATRLGAATVTTAGAETKSPTTTIASTIPTLAMKPTRSDRPKRGSESSSSGISRGIREFSAVSTAPIRSAHPSIVDIY